jgi:hypothetical protein
MVVGVGPGTGFVYSTDGGETFASVYLNADGKNISEKFEAWNKVVGPLKRMYFDVEFVKDRFIATGAFTAAVELLPKDGALTFVSDTQNEEDIAAFGRGIAYDGTDRVILFGHNSFQSTDSGKTWSNARKLKEYRLEKGVFAKNTWVGCGSFGTIIYSKDGKTWEKADGHEPRSLTIYYSCTFGNGRFYAASDEADQFVYSNDGVKWSVQQAGHHADNEEQYKMNFYVIQPVSL